MVIIRMNINIHERCQSTRRLVTLWLSGLLGLLDGYLAYTWLPYSPREPRGCSGLLEGYSV